MKKIFEKVIYNFKLKLGICKNIVSDNNFFNIKANNSISVYYVSL
jgi:hypothetical protein